jgi:hypothetical protein
VPALALPVVAAVYLSTPDTEGSVVLAASLVPVAAVSRIDQWRGPASTIACWVLSIVAGTVAVAWFDAAGHLSLGGWWLAKVGLGALEVAMVVFALQEFRTSAPVRPPP